MIRGGLQRLSTDLRAALLEEGSDESGSATMNRETHALYLPDILVGVGFPGNPKSTNAQASGAGAGLDGCRSSGGLAPTLRRLVRLSPRAEWCLRAGISTTLALALVLHPRAPAFLRKSVWLVVLSLACAKPTLGDTLEGWWIAVSGGTIGVALAAVLIPFGALGQAGCACALAAGFFALVLAFGEHVQGRWAMLPVMSSLLKAAATQDVHASLLKSPVLAVP